MSPPPWKLVVEDLGRIGHAEIEARPLLLFVGQNNTGKTYLASMLWGLLSLSRELPLTRGPAYQRCAAWLHQRFAHREQESSIEVTPEVHGDLVQIVNDTMREQGGTLAERAFNRPGFRIGKIEIRDVARRSEMPVRLESFEEEGRLVTMLSVAEGPSVFGRPHDDILAYAVDYLAWGHILGVLADRGNPVFLPASRTGFMLLYRSLAQRLVGDALVKTGAARPRAPDLTRPAVDFVELLMNLRPDTLGAYPEEAALLEQALGGRLSVQSDIGQNEVRYEHTPGEPSLPMQLSSSLVTELAPLVLTLRHVSGYRVLIIEEPEAHLHPHIQRALAQVIVRLVRKGLYVWITTHSENFCQQINNFLKIGALPPEQRAEAQEKLGYAEQDYLDLDDVGGYELTVEGAQSVVHELKKTPQGLVMPGFNKELFDLAKEVDYLDDLAAGKA